MARDPSIRKGRDGIFYLRTPVIGTRRREWISTGERDIKRARAVVQEFGADRLVHLAHARALTHDTIAIATTGRRITWTDVIKLWLEWLEMRSSPATVSVYLGYVRRLVEFYGVANQPMQTLSERQLYEWVNDPRSSYQTASTRLAAVRSVYRFASAKAMVIGNPSQLVDVDHRIMTVEQKEPRHHQPVTEAEYQAMLGAFPRPQRDWTILAYCCGLRLCDCVGLQWASFTATQIVIYPSKARRAKRLGLPLSEPLVARPELQELIAQLLATRAEGAKPADEIYVWPRHKEALLIDRGSAFSQDFTRRMRRLGIEGRSFHSLRTAFARRLEAAGKTVDQIAQAMGHEDTATTGIYLGR